MCYWVRLSTLYMAGHCGHGCPGYQRHNHTLGNTPPHTHTPTSHQTQVWPWCAQYKLKLYSTGQRFLVKENFCPLTTPCQLPEAITCGLHGTAQLVAGSSRASSMSLPPLGVILLIKSATWSPKWEEDSEVQSSPSTSK